MKNISYLLFLTGLFLLWLLVAPAYALVLKLETDKHEYALGEPVVLYVSLQNSENLSVELPKFLDPKYYEVQYEINGKRFIPWILIDDLEPTKTFASNEILREEVKLFFNGKHWIFSEPGTYTIVAKLRDQTSNTLTITIPSAMSGGSTTSVLHGEGASVSSSDPVGQAAQLLFSSDDAGFFLLFEGEGAQFLTEGVQVLQTIVTDYPNTPQATFAREALGNSQLFIGNYQQALPLLEAAKQQPIGLYDTIHTYMALYKSYMGLGNTQGAKAVLEELKGIVLKQFSDFKPFVNVVLSKNQLPTLFDEQQSQPIIIMGIQFCTQNSVLLSSTTGEALHNFNTGLTGKGIHLTTADFDGNKLTDAIVVSEIGKGNIVLIFDVNGQQIDTIPISGDNQGINVAAGDIDGNGTSEIVMARASEDTKVYIYQARDKNVREITVFDTQTKFNLTTGDVNGDGSDEIVLALAKPKNDKNVFVFNGKGDLLQSFVTLLNGEIDKEAMVVAAGDVNGDGIDEIIVGPAEPKNDYTVVIYSASGSLIKTFNSFSESADRKKDNETTICHIPPGNSDQAHTITVSDNAMEAHLAHGDQLGECKNNGSSCSFYEPPGIILATGDVNEDGKSEIVVSKAGSREVRFYTIEGSLIGQFDMGFSDAIITDVSFGVKAR